MPLEEAVGFVPLETEGQPELVMSQPPLTVEFNEHRFLGHHIEVGEFPAELIFHRSRQVEADGHSKILVGPDDFPVLSDWRQGRADLVDRDSYPSAEPHRSPSAAEKKPFQKNGWGGIWTHERLSPLPVFKVGEGGSGYFPNEHP